MMGLKRFYKTSGYKLGDCTLSSELGLPCIDISPVLEKVETGGFGPRDANGIPMVDFSKWNQRNLGVVYSRHLEAVYALALSSRYQRNKDETTLADFLLLVDWLQGKGKSDDDTTCWLQEFPNPAYDLKPFWPSALIQGRMLSVLSRAYQFTHKSEYISQAEAAWRFLLRPVADGGVAVRGSGGNLWLEEYPSMRPSYVLNGFIFTIFGMYDLYRITRNDELWITIEECLDSVEASLNEFDTGYWTRYDLYWRNLASQHYHSDIHLLQMQALFQLSGREIFNRYAEKWGRYAQNKTSAIIWNIAFPFLGIRKRIGMKYRIFSPHCNP